MSAEINKDQFLTPQVKKVDDYLRKYGLEDRLILIEENIRTANQTSQALGVSTSEIAKSLLILIDNSPVVVILPGVKKVDFHQLKGITGAKEVKLASPDLVNQLTGFDIRGVSPVAHKQELPVFIDDDLSKFEVIYAAAGSDHAVFRTSYFELLTLTQGTSISMNLTKAKRYYWIDEQVREIGVKFKVAEVHSVNVRTEDSALEESKKIAVQHLINTKIKNQPILQGYRDLFTTIGVEGVVASPEFLLRFIQKQGNIPQINTVVDAYNEVSAKKFIVASAHDLAKIDGDVRLVISTGNEVFYPVGRGGKSEKPDAGMWIGVDDSHVLCLLNCKQSELSKVSLRTSDLLIYVQGNEVTSEEYLQNSLVEICQHIIKFNGGKYYLLDIKG